MTDRSPDAEEVLPGNVGGAVRVGTTVRRPTGPWTPAVHALLRHLDGRLPGVPRVLGFDEEGREVLDFLPGEVVDLQVEHLSDARLVALVDWVKTFHAAVAGFDHPGPWRLGAVGTPVLVCHNDLGAYNLCWDGDDLAGVFDWDAAGPSNPLLELAFVAWNGVPMWAVDRDVDRYADVAAQRLALVADTYGGVSPVDLLHAVPERIQVMVDGIARGAAAGDTGLANLITAGHHARDVATLAVLRERVPAVERALRT